MCLEAVTLEYEKEHANARLPDNRQKDRTAGTAGDLGDLVYKQLGQCTTAMMAVGAAANDNELYNVADKVYTITRTLALDLELLYTRSGANYIRLREAAYKLCVANKDLISAVEAAVADGHTGELHCP